MPTLTYKQAVKIYTIHAEKFENKIKKLDNSIHSFLRTVRKSMEIKQTKKEQKVLKQLEKKLAQS